MAYSIEFRPAASREFNRLTEHTQARIKPNIDALAGAPRPPGCQKLRGADNLWRIRIGDYCVVYQIRDQFCWF